MYDFFIYIRALIHIVNVRLCFFFLPFNQILNQLKRQKKIHNHAVDVRKISNLIRRINKLIPGNSCLIDSVIIYTFLKKYKGDLEFIIGVKKDIKGNFMSHAWIAYNNTPLEGSRNINFKEILKIK